MPSSATPREPGAGRATYALIHGAGDVAWYWHLVEAELRRRGQDVVAMDLPIEDDAAGLSEYADVVVEAIGDRRDVVVVAQSFGGYVAPMVCDRVGVRLLVLVAGMVPAPGESAEEMFANTGYEPEPRRQRGTRDIFYQDVPASLARAAMARSRRQSDTPGKQRWPLAGWPEVPTRFLLCRNDRFFPARWLQRVVRDRLGITPDEIDSGHTPALSRPTELAARLERYRTDLAARPR
jgi:pimeloyl-ACP methyl ester carboxylesterase